MTAVVATPTPLPTPTPILPINTQITKIKRKGKRNAAELETPCSELQSIAEETNGDDEVPASPKKITRRQSAMEIATTINNAKPTVSSRPKRTTGRK